MKFAPVPDNEQERLASLNEYYILDTLPEAAFDDITRIAAGICNTPISLVSIIDKNRQWFKSHHGIALSETQRDISFCAHAIARPAEIFVVNDLAKDDRFHDNPMVTGETNIQFYAGVPLVNSDGYALGTLCVLDNSPNNLTSAQIKTLQALARQIVAQLKLRRKVIELRETQAELNSAYHDLEQFSHIASHDLKSPLNNIISLTHLLKDGYGTVLDEDANEYIRYLNDSAYQLADLVSGILNYSKSSHLLMKEKEDIDFAALLQEIATLVSIPANMELSFDHSTFIIHTSRIALKQILLNLVHNAIKYNDKQQGKIQVTCHAGPADYVIEVADNGPGIEEEHKEKAFELFERLHHKRYDGESQGIGLAIAKRLVQKLGGEIKINSEMGKGATFLFSIPK